MADENETLEPAASPEQPADQAVESPAEEAEVQAPASDTPAEVTPDITPRLFAGKYKTVEELEEAYRSSNAENSRMAGELSRNRSASQEPEKPKYSQEQLETWKEGHIRQVARCENLAAKAQADGNLSDYEKYGQAAAESARQIRMIDAELRKIDIQSSTQSVRRQSAEQRIMAEARSVLTQYSAELVPGTELHTKASELLSTYEAMGQDPASPFVQAQAVAMAAQVLGLGSKKVAQTTRKQMVQSMNDALKKGVVTAPGKAGKTSTTPDFLAMSDEDFVAYKAKRGWD